MLPSKNRLSLTSNRQNLLKGKKVASSEFQIIGNKHQGAKRIATVVSKKVAKRAVDRNRIKRLITEAIRTNLEKIKFEGEIIVIAKENIAKLKKADIEDKLINLISQL